MIRKLLTTWLLLVGLAWAAPVKINSSLITGTTYTDSGVTDGQSYYYYATSVDSSGTESSLTSNIAQAKIPTTGVHIVILTWTASTSSVAGYNMYRDVLAVPNAPGNVKTKVD